MAGQIKSTFVADFSSFSQAVSGAQVKLRDFEADSNKVGTALDRMGNKFSGQKIKQEAVLMGEAFKQLSEKGIKLTSDELAQMATVTDAAIAKFHVMGQAVPKDIQAVSDASKDATKGWAGFVESFDPKKAVADPLGTAMEAITAFADSFGVLGTVALGAVTGLTAAATAMFRLAEQSAGAGAKIQNLYEKTGITAPALSKLSQAATIAGEDVASIGNAIFMFDKQIADNPDKVAKGLSRIGLSIEEIQKLNPEEQFTKISGALAGMANVQTRNAAGAEIFGRAAKDLMPLIVNLNEAMTLTNGLSIWTPEQAKEAEEFEMGLNALKLGAQEATLVIGKDLIPTLKILVDLANNNKGVIQDVIGGVQDATGLTALKEATRLLTEFERLKKVANTLPTVAPPAGMGGPQDDVAKGFKAGQEAAQEQVVAIQLLDTHLRKLKETVVPLTEAQQAQATAMLKGGDSAATAARFMGVAEKSVQDFAEAQKELNKELAKTVLQEYIANYQEVGPTLKSFEDHQKIAAGALDATTKAFGRQTDAIIRILPRFSQWHEEVTGLRDDNGNLSATVLDLGMRGLPGLDDAMGKVGMSTAEARQHLKDLRLESLSLGDALKGLPGQIADIFQRAFEGGGGLLGAVQSSAVLIGTTFAKGLRNTIQEQIDKGKPIEVPVGSAAGMGLAAGVGALAGGGSAMQALGAVSTAAIAATASVVATTGAMTAAAVTAGAWTAGIGAAAIGVYLLAKHFLAVSKAEKEARVEFEKFGKAIGTSNVDEFIAKVGKAYADLGMDGETARKGIQSVLDATHKSPAALATALAPIAAIIDQAADLNATLETIAEASTHIEHALPAALRATITQLMRTAGATDAVKAALQGVLDAAEPNFETLTSRASEFGISLEALGPKFEQANIEQRSKAITDLFTDLTDAGGDVGGILSGLSKKISGLVQDSQKFGSAIPENMKPLIEELARSGKLLDEQGDKITDTSQLKFEGTPLDKSLDGLNKAIDHLAEVLGSVPSKIDKIGEAANRLPKDPFANYAPPGPRTQDMSAGTTPSGASGGSSNLVAFPGRRVPLVTPTQQRAVLSGGASGGPIEITLVTQLDGRVVAETVTRVQDNDQRLRRKMRAA